MVSAVVGFARKIKLCYYFLCIQIYGATNTRMIKTKRHIIVNGKSLKLFPSHEPNPGIFAYILAV